MRQVIKVLGEGVSVRLQRQAVFIARGGENLRDGSVRIQVFQRSEGRAAAGLVKPIQDRISFFILDDHIAADQHFPREKTQRFAVYGAEEAGGSLVVHLHFAEFLGRIFFIAGIPQLDLHSVVEDHRAAEMIGDAGGRGEHRLDSFGGILQPNHQSADTFIIQHAGLDKIFDGIPHIRDPGEHG